MTKIEKRESTERKLKAKKGMEQRQELERLMKLFKLSNGVIRPHFFITGPSGAGKTHTVKTLARELDIPMVEVNGAQLTKEGTSGNSLSKALTGVAGYGDTPCIVFVDEFDKLFISGNTNLDLAHESTNGVQNELLKALDGGTLDLYGDYAKYIACRMNQCLFVFAGAFNNQDGISVEDLRNFGVKNEFLGRVNLIYNLDPIKFSDLETMLDDIDLYKNYTKLFKKKIEESGKTDEVVKKEIMELARKYSNFDLLGVRSIYSIIHKYFILGFNVTANDLKQNDVAREAEVLDSIDLDI